MKKVFVKWSKSVLLFAVTLMLCACAQYQDIQGAEQGNAVLGENIFIDGIDVSGMDAGEAKQKITQAHNDALAQITYMVRAGEDSVSICGSELPINDNLDEVLLLALSLKKYYPRNNEPRKFTTQYSIDMEKLRISLTDFTQPLNKKPKSAAVSYDGKHFSYIDAMVGRQVNIGELAGRVAQGLDSGERELIATTSEIAPEYTMEMVQRDTELISEFTTSFAGSTYSKKNRVFNIKKATQMINGVMLDEGEEFDMNATIGDRNGQNGWKEAAAIRDGTYEQEYGGGVCQVSTTLYNAVLMADMEIIERWHHSWPLGYVDIGRDATISTDGPNFKFKNNLDSPIYISSVVDEKQKIITVRIYGRRRADGIHVSITSKKVDHMSNPGNEVLLDKSLPANTRQEKRKARAGSIAETYKQYLDEQGKLIKRELVSRDKYRPIKGLIYVSSDIYYGVAETYEDIWENYEWD
ncbi:MAG: VanW family protein [Clostridia bacterium]